MNVKWIDCLKCADCGKLIYVICRLEENGEVFHYYDETQTEVFKCTCGTTLKYEELANW